VTPRIVAGQRPDLRRRDRVLLRDRDQRLVAQQERPREIEAGGLPLAPGGERAGHGADARRLPVETLDAAPRGRRGHRVVGRRERRRVLHGPLEPAERDEPALELGGRRRQVLDVLARVADLLGRERTPEPVGAGLVLAELDPEQRLHERRVRQARADPGEDRGDLRVEQRPRRGPGGAAKDGHVAGARMQDLAGAGGAEERRERRQVADPRRVDERDLARRGDLDDAELRAVGPLEHELGVERDRAARRGPAIDRGHERIRTIDPGRTGSHATGSNASEGAWTSRSVAARGGGGQKMRVAGSAAPAAHTTPSAFQ